MDSTEYGELLVWLFQRRFTEWDYVIIFGFWLAILAIFAWLRPFKFTWSDGFFRSNVTNFLFSWGNIFFAPFVFFAYRFIKAAFDELGLPHLDEAVWDGVPIWIAALIATFFGDFADYWNHRVMHQKWLWPIHAIHHSDSAINPLSTYRVHFLEPFVMRLSYLLILGWLGLPLEAVTFGAIFFTLHNMYVHITVDWDHGPFKYILASPRMHQWHHADTPEAHGKNLANVFPFFDVLFGTYYVPGPCKERFGVTGLPDHDFVSLTLHPFVQLGQWVLRITRLGRFRRASTPT